MRVAIAEDSVLLREGLVRLLGDAGFDVIAQCANADDLRLKVDSYPLDVAIVDIRLPPAHKDEGLDIGPDAPGWISDFAGVRIQAGSERPVFLGIGPTSDVTRYLARVQHSQITDFDSDPVRFSSREVAGRARPAPPTQQSFWRVRAAGSGTQTVTWPLEKGNWSAVAMNADGSRGVSLALRVGAHIPALRWVAVGFLAGGAVVLLVGASLLYLGVRRRDSELEHAGAR